MPNLFRHLIESNSYETLNQVQGDKTGITTQSPIGERERVRGEFSKRKFNSIICSLGIPSSLAGEG